MTELTHFDNMGDARMVDVGEKDTSHRRATVRGEIRMKPQTLQLIRDGGHQKGDVLGIARIAGIMACKKTAELIPLCHPLMLTSVNIDFELNEKLPGVVCEATVQCHQRTGVEMEALVAVQTALATIYDMCKAVDRGMVLGQISLLEKHGGKSGRWIRDA